MIRRFWIAGSGVAGLLALWQLATSLNVVDPFFVGSPAGAAREAVRLSREGKIWVDVVVTLVTMAKGLGLALLVGVPLSILLGRWRQGWALVELPMVTLNAIPTVALVPPIILTIGIGPGSKVVLAFIGALIPIVFNGRTAAASVPEAYVRAAQVYGAGRLEVFLKVVVPYSLLAILTGVRLGVGRALTAVLVGELYATQQGLGLWLTRGQVGLNADLLLFVTFFVAGVGALLIAVVNAIDRSFAAWRA